MTRTTIQERNARLTTPRSAAFAVIIFALLFAASLVFLRLSIPSDLTNKIEWIAQTRERLSIALVLVPFAGIAFLWFIGVIRDRFGELEDRFFSTVFFGSSLLFIGMVFVAMAVAGALTASMVYFLHIALKAEVIPLVLLLLSVVLVVVDYPRRYFYLTGLVLYPLITAINVAIARDQSLYPIVIFYELSMVAMILFGTFLGIKAKRWIEARKVKI